MNGLIEQAGEFVLIHRQWAGPIVGVLCLGESLAIVGLFVPATAAMLVIGGLIGAEALDVLPIVVWAVVGSIAGDWLSYGMGNKIGPKIYRCWPLNRHRTAVARTRLFFRKYGFAAIFMGRFLGPIRATIPLVAGVLSMPRKPFQLGNIASALLWVPLMFAPGYLAANKLDDLGEVDAAGVLAIGLVFCAFGIGSAWLTSRLLKRRRGKLVQLRLHRKRAKENTL